MARRDYAWRNFCRDIEYAERQLKELKYSGVFNAPVPPTSLWDTRRRTYPFFVPDIFTSNLRQEHLGSRVVLSDIHKLLSEAALSPPHGLEILNAPSPPEMPELPEMPPHSSAREYELRYIEDFEKLASNIDSVRKRIGARMLQEKQGADQIAAGCKAGCEDAIRKLITTNLVRHPLPEALASQPELFLDKTARIALCTIEVPDFRRLPFGTIRYLKQGRKWSPASEAAKKKASQTLVRALCVRAGYLVAKSDPGDFFDTVAVNAHQAWFDPATGAPREGIVASLQASKHDLSQLNPKHLDADACFRHFAGITTPNLLNAAPIRPIFVMDRNDQRIVANKDVDAQLEQSTNLAAMPWEDFEHLVRQLFEWMFTSEGVEVNVTRATRDRGVDAIVFDPDPIRGGKFVIQAKRYTRSVDVAAVRDLYGTVVNEGANRGILVTTSSYGPDAYEFAKDKPISLVDGPNLVTLLRRYGRRYRVDLEEARRIAAEQ